MQAKALNHQAAAPTEAYTSAMFHLIAAYYITVCWRRITLFSDPPCQTGTALLCSAANKPQAHLVLLAASIRTHLLVSPQLQLDHRCIASQYRHAAQSQALPQ
jgi:hypothetical protein